MTHEAILEAVRGPWQLAVPPGLPPVLQEMMMAALSKEPQNRCAPLLWQRLQRLCWKVSGPACAWYMRYAAVACYLHQCL